MRKAIILLILILSCLVLKAQTKKTPLWDFGTPDTGGGTILMQSENDSQFIISYDFLDSPIVIHLVKNKPVADKPYMVFVRKHSLIIFCRGRKIGAFKWINKPFQLTNLKLN